MAVRIRMKKMGRRHRPFFRICAVDARRPRDGRVLEELGTYDPMVGDVDARAVLNGERVDYWISVGAQPSDKVAVLIKKYGTNGTHADAQRDALARQAQPKMVPAAAPPKMPEPEAAVPQDEATAEAPAEEQAAESTEGAE